MNQATNDQDELTQFKTQINLCEYLESCGWVLDQKESKGQTKTMRIGGTGSKSEGKIVVWLDGSTWLYRNMRDGGDKGSIIDFVMNHLGLNLGQVRIELRKWLGTAKPSTPSIYQEPKKKPFNRQVIIQQWEGFQTIVIHPYLNFRGISSDIQQDIRFSRRFRGMSDQFNNVVFPHYDRVGLCGFESKNKGFTGFCTGGNKGLWFSRNAKTAQAIYIMEAVIDCLSHAQLNINDNFAYVSIGGSFGGTQAKLIESLINKGLERGQQIIIAVDNDQGGDKIANQIQALTDIKLERVKPKGKDWNDDLKQN